MRVEDCWYLEVCNKFPEGCSQTCIRFVEMHTLLELSNIPESRWFPVDLIPGSDKSKFLRLRDIKNDIKEWVQQGHNLYLYSFQYGNGKTSWAIKLLLAYFNSIWAGNGFRRRGIFLSVPEFLDRNREAMSNRDEEFVVLRQDLLSCDLVVWDDITSTKLTDYNHSMLLNYLDARILGNKSNVFTGNVDYESMQTYLGGRLASRIWNTSEVIQFIDQDKRGVKV